MSTHLHWIIQACEYVDEQGSCHDNTTLDLMAMTQEFALDRARELVPGKRVYRVANVIEHFNDQQCGRA